MKKKPVVVVKKKRPVFNDLIPSKKLDFWIENNYNVLFEGRHGVGKTALILDAFRKHFGKRWAYFSGSTMDPFIDFVGVPVNVGGHIVLLRPEHLIKLDVQAIFIDEFNRTHKKVRNAVMELLQFKKINGKPISSDLRVVWAAVNPDDEEGEYDVDRLDPAQRDRFHVQMKIPYACSAEFFSHKFGAKLGDTAVRFWNKLPDEIQKTISPRRMEYALQVFKDGGDLRDVLPPSANPGRLMQLLKGGGYKELDPLLKDKQQAQDFFANESNFATYSDEVIKQKKYHPLLEAMPAEKIVALVSRPKRDGVTVQNYIRHTIRLGNGWQWKPMLESIEQANQSHRLTRWAKMMLALLNSPKTKGGKMRVPQGKTTVPVLIRAALDCAAQNVPAVISYLGIKLKNAKKLRHTPSAAMIERRMNKFVKPWLERHGYTVVFDQAQGMWAVSK